MSLTHWPTSRSKYNNNGQMAIWLATMIFQSVVLWLAWPVEQLVSIQLLRGSSPLTFLSSLGKCVQFSHLCQDSTLGVKNSVHYIASKIYTSAARPYHHHLWHRPWGLIFMRFETVSGSEAGCIDGQPTIDPLASQLASQPKPANQPAQ